MAWYDPSFSYKKSIRIPHGNITGGSDLFDFPLLVSITDARLASMANGGLVASSSGYDLLFVDSTETKELPYEVESYTASSGAVVCWVRIPVLSASQDTVFFLYFGNAQATAYQANAALVWDNFYKGVYHLGENTTSTVVKDSTVTVNTGTNVANTSTKTTTGKIGSGLSYNGSSDYTTLSRLVQDDFTLSCWFKTSGTGAGTNHYQLMTLISAEEPPTSNSFAMGIDSNGKLAFGTGGGLDFTFYNSFAVNDNAWHYGCITRQKSTGSFSIYADGFLNSSFTILLNAGISLSANPLMKFGAQDSGSGVLFNGTLDEVRISNSIRSSDWIATEYSNQSSPGTFMIVGPTIPVPVPVIGQSLLVTSSVTTTQSSSDQINGSAKGVKLTLNTTLLASDDPLTLTVQGKDATSGQYYTAGSFSNLSLGTTILTLYPGLAASSTTVNASLPRTWRVQVSPTTSEAASYTVGSSLVG